MAALRISNRQARALLIKSHGLSKPPSGPIDVAQLIRNMGYVQLDTIRAVVRAHHHILWSRNQNYREHMLWDALKNRDVFEHFTHDASILPIEMHGLWKRQFSRMKSRFETSTRWSGYSDLHDEVLARVAAEGPLSTHDFDTKIEGPKEMWARPPHKRALDYLWYVGELSTCHRENFTKFYDVTERVIPQQHRACQRTDNERLSLLCEHALQRVSVATKAELKDFWDVGSAAEIAAWLQVSNAYVPLEIESNEGQWTAAYAAPDIETRLADLKMPTSRLRILSPFDPLVRDRKRLLRVFGMDFKIEIFVPAAKRKWGYYVHPILERDKFVGRIDLKADRKTGTLNVLGFWPELGVKWTAKREEKLQAELARLTRFAGVTYKAHT